MHDHPVVVQHVEPNRVTLKDFGFKNDLFKAEILWALCSTDAHLSNRQSEKLSQTFKLMFPDSQVARHWGPSGIIPDLQFRWPMIDSHSGQNVCEGTLTLWLMQSPYGVIAITSGKVWPTSTCPTDTNCLCTVYREVYKRGIISLRRKYRQLGLVALPLRRPSQTSNHRSIGATKKRKKSSTKFQCW